MPSHSRVLKVDDEAPAKPQAAPIPEGALAQRSGLELLQRVLAGELARAPIAELLNFALVQVERGRVVFEGKPTPAFFNMIGSIHGGWAATLLDSSLGCAVHTMLPAGKGYTTVELKVNYTRLIMPDCRRLRAEAKVIHVGRRIGTAESRLMDAVGRRLYAHATTTCLIFDSAEAKSRRK
jgi:uncharacterized protein (TIGR00369 family)